MRFLSICLCLSVFVTFVSAQEKVRIDEGPVMAFTKYNQVPGKEYNDGKLYLEEPVFLQKGDWLNVCAISSEKRLYVLLFDFAEKKYIRVSDDSIYQSSNWHGNLTWTCNRTDTFAIMIAVSVERGDPEDWYSSVKIDTPKISFTISRYRKPASDPGLGWSFPQRLSYLSNHWMAGFRAMPRKANPQSVKNGKPAYEYFPEIPVTLLDSMGASVMELGYSRHNSYFQYTADMPYKKAKEVYNKLQGLLKQNTSKMEVTNFNAPNQFRRVNELETTLFFIKIPAKKVPVEYFLFNKAGPGFANIPISLFLFGNKEWAKVLIVMGEDGDDIYDIGIN